MEIAWQNVALAIAGIIGACVAVVHGIRVQRFMVRPFEEFALADKRIAGRTRRLVPLLLHFSTIAWFLGGLVCRQSLGHARSSSWLDAHGCRARAYPARRK